jgi:hypothetical protein
LVVGRVGGDFGVHALSVTESILVVKVGNVLEEGGVGCEFHSL